MVKSVPEFDGKQENYVSWRQAATAAHGKKGSQPGFNKKKFIPKEKPDDKDYDSVAQACAAEIEDELDTEDSCNFLG